jgi:hypothetical protein
MLRLGTIEVLEGNIFRMLWSSARAAPIGTALIDTAPIAKGLARAWP